jgi:colanic acid/amylovoran biosynthesis glycosyltransferase
MTDRLAPPRARVAHLSTHYPSISHSFILREILALRDLGVDVEPLAINVAPANDLLTEADRAEHACTFYIKGRSKRQIIASVLHVARRHPAALLSTAVLAVRTAGFDVKAAIWRLLQLVEAIVVWDHCREIGVRHIHAHFGQAPATIAWFAAELGNRIDGSVSAGTDDDGPWSWSVTIHGWHEFVGEREASLREKVAAATFVACISDYTRSQLMRIAHPDHWHKLHVVRCGIDTTTFPQRPPQPVRSTPRVLMVARLSPEKGHLVLLEAVALLRDRGRRVDVDLVGPGEFREDIERAARALHIDDRVHLLGARSPAEINAQLRASDIFCLPSFAEGLPVALMEAMAVGVPVVTTYISGIPELVVDGFTGMVVPAGRADLLASAIDRLCDDRQLTASIVSSARAKVEEQHELAHNVRALADLLAGNHAQQSSPARLP